jgi:transposase-like protein
VPKKNRAKPAKKRRHKKHGGPRIIDMRAQLDDVGGRPTKYRPEFARVAEHLSIAGATDVEIARACGVDVRTLYRWKAQLPGFRQSIQGAKQLPSDRVERSLYHRAVGYEHDHDEIRANGSAVTVIKTVKHYPPETAAARLWLHNQESGRWHPRNEPPPPPPPSEAAKTDLEELTDDELDARLERIDAARRAAAGELEPKKKRARK